MNKTRLFVTSFIIFLAAITNLASANLTGFIPSTSLAAYQTQVNGQVFTIPTLESFKQELPTASGEGIRGVYVPGIFAYQVIQQPAGNPAMVSKKANTLTQFGMAVKFKTLGFLAHNYLAGQRFYKINIDQLIVIVDNKAKVRYYRVSQIEKYQALSPTSPQSKFVDLKNPNSVLTAADLFYDIYAQGDRVVLQTCIEAEGVASWGRLFIIAVPLDTSFTEYLNQFSINF